MYQRIDTRGAKPATVADGAPTAEELIAAYDVPAHRHAAVRRELAAYGRRNDLSGGIVSSLKVSKSREEGRGLKDRLRRLGEPRRDHELNDRDGRALELTNIGLLISRGRGHMVVREQGLRGALAIGAMLRSLPLRSETIGAHYLGQRIIDSVITGDAEKDHDRDMAHGWATWLSIVLADPAPAAVDVLAVEGWRDMFAAASIHLDEASSLLMRIVHLVEAEGPYVDRGGEQDIVDRIWTQLALDDLFDQLSADPAVLAVLEQRRQDRRAWQAARRATVPAAQPAPSLPGLFD